MEEDTPKIWDTTWTVFIQGPSIVPPVLCIFWAFIPRVWFSYSSFQQVRQPSIPSPVEEDTSKIRDTTGTVFIQGPSIVLPVGAYFELLFLGCGFLIHLSNKSDSPRFRAPSKKIRQKYGTRQEPSLFKGILLLVWRCIMFNGSYLRACMKLQIV